MWTTTDASSVRSTAIQDKKSYISLEERMGMWDWCMFRMCMSFDKKIRMGLLTRKCVGWTSISNGGGCTMSRLQVELPGL